jgi:methylaspartate mutase sigma subunit
MEDNLNPKATLVTGVIGEDVHIVGIRILEHALRAAGYRIVALGAQTPQDEFINAARETKADAILVSSLSGHANVLVAGFRDKCNEAGMKDIILYLGGQLIIGEMAWPEVEKIYTGMGFNRVYRPDMEIPRIIQDLETDLNKRK